MTGRRQGTFSDEDYRGSVSELGNDDQEVSRGSNSVYVLLHPATREPRYVGKTAFPSLRLREHISTARSKGFESLRPVSLWVRELADEGLLPEMMVISTASTDDISATERFWIREICSKGGRLLNIRLNH